MTYHRHGLPGPAIVAIEFLSEYDQGQGLTLIWISPNLWKISDSGCLVTADTIQTLHNDGLITVKQAGRDLLHDHHNARRDHDQ
ncbi:hypothetical protein [Nonomuraea sp. NPDC049141]|uniref:hypothetical protein n=1 Tax=Nonomuraea sp. NPDC049141 TaxID=3155500 RepID=UPI0033F28423